MAWLPIDDTTITNDERSLSAGMGVDLGSNAETLLSSRLKRHAVAYYLGPTAASGSAPPSTDTGLLGPACEVAGVAGNSPEGIGLRLSSPPTVPLALCLGDWPLSARATSLRVIVTCATELADVDVFAFAAIGGGLVPHSPMRNLEIDSEGAASFNTTITGSSSYQRIGTSSPTGEDAKPVDLTIDLGSARGVDLGFAGDGDELQSCRVYLAILSRVGIQDPSYGQGTVDEWHEGGRRIVDGQHFQTLGINPGAYHRWVFWPGNADTAIDVDSATSWSPQWRGVVQIRPSDIDSPSAGHSYVSFVIHPPIETESAIRTDPDFEIWQCGTIQIHGVSIQEIAT